MYLLTQRWYNPVVGRFVVRDPLKTIKHGSLYFYCDNEPINSADPLGERKNKPRPQPGFHPCVSEIKNACSGIHTPSWWDIGEGGELECPGYGMISKCNNCCGTLREYLRCALLELGYRPLTSGIMPAKVEMECCENCIQTCNSMQPGKFFSGSLLMLDYLKCALTKSMQADLEDILLHLLSEALFSFPQVLPPITPFIR
jgi:hypothetical protein